MKSISDDNSNVIYCRFIIKNGKKIYPKKSKVFRFIVSDKKAS